MNNTFPTRVFVADNSGEFGERCTYVLQGYGMEVTLLPKDGAEILALLESGNIPDVLIIDAFMQRIDGMGVLKDIQKMKLPKKPLILVMSSVDNSRFEYEILNSGADYYFLKPFDVNIMGERIQQLICDTDTSNTNNYVKPTPTENNPQVAVTEFLHKIGVPAHIKGYQYLREAILLAINDPSVINSVTKLLYPAIADNHGTTSSRVERAIRHAIEVAWDRGNINVLNSYFGDINNRMRRKPTNSEFIAMISDDFRMQFNL